MKFYGNALGKMVKIIPTIEELLPNYKIYCLEENCTSTFTNRGNYYFHLLRRHKIVQKCEEPAEYLCPDENCSYNNCGKTFIKFNYLCQHYRKVHANKDIICEKCGKRFLTNQQFQLHKLKECSINFICLTCGWKFNTFAALHVHGKRKEHKIKEDKINTRNYDGKVAIPKFSKRKTLISNQHSSKNANDDKAINRRLSATVNDEYLLQNMETQTDQLLALDVEKILCDIETQTEAIGYSNLEKSIIGPLLLQTSISTQTHFQDFRHKIDALQIEATTTNNNFPCNVETQTEHKHSQISTTNQESISLFVPMQTQTSDDIFSDFGLANIQTQTNWTDFEQTSLDDQPHLPTLPHDELVSTETQTSFTQCLLESNMESSGAFESLYTTQYTQTCDELRLFGEQGNDLTNTMDADLE